MIFALWLNKKCMRGGESEREPIMSLNEKWCTALVLLRRFRASVPTAASSAIRVPDSSCESPGVPHGQNCVPPCLSLTGAHEHALRSMLLYRLLEKASAALSRLSQLLIPAAVFAPLHADGPPRIFSALPARTCILCVSIWQETAARTRMRAHVWRVAPRWLPSPDSRFPQGIWTFAVNLYVLLEK